ncbi:MAG: pesticidal protein Cry7Aa [Bacteroidales bacterium]|nr:pesticidal protein Cry7Aa [Bacteroidales bacterium]
MIKVKKEGIILEKTLFEFENEGVLNPGAIKEGENVHLFYRAVRNGNYSSIGYCRMDGPLTIGERWEKPILVPEFDYESHGVEDARIVKIDDLYHLTYTAYDGINARGALATSKDMRHFQKHGLIVPPLTYAKFNSLCESAGVVNKKYYHNKEFYNHEADPEEKMMLWDKNVIFFPRRIKDNLVFLHRIRPGIQIVSVKNLKELTLDFWTNYCLHLDEHIIMDPLYVHESRYIGGGCPPIETKHGWLLIYHGAEEVNNGIVYSACAAALLDLNNPVKVIARLPYALFSPEYVWEKRGDVNNVVFPTGTALFGDTLYIYYGAADSRIACASLSFSALLKELINNTLKDEK